MRQDCDILSHQFCGHNAQVRNAVRERERESERERERERDDSWCSYWWFKKMKYRKRERQ